ncbi:response regulator [Paenibacillus mendelii]|uniref:Response regulator n=1 Tax=Paenibacillus mendelii TaxID=206163 RepID=A0ABV6JFC9_9BACL|nr:response regulator [Paenibacillus mendelii]MCQ6563376.1 response regulator [Paenibacillus mendelii]
MLTVLLVEDEILVRESVKRIIPWESLGFQVVAEADHGEEAMTCIRQFNPDLVITDIIMPIMNGVDLLKEARKEGYESRFIVLSCMSDFEYVREAMEYGASNYILKLSMNIESLTEALQKVKLEMLKDSSQQVTSLQPFYEHIWGQIGEQVIVQKSDIRERFPLTGFEGLHLIVLVSTHGSETFDKNKLLRMELWSHVQPQTIHTFSKWGQTAFFCWFTAEKDAEHVLENLRKTQLMRYRIEYSSVVRLEQLYEAWGQALSRSDRYWYEEKRDNALLEDPSTFAGEQDLWKMERIIILVFEQMKADRCCERLIQLFDHMRIQQKSMYRVKETARRLSQTFSRIMNQPLELQSEIALCGSHEQLCSMLIGMVQTKLQQWERNFPILTDHPEINKVVDYIRMNYHQEITVKSMAKLVAMDEKYLSGLFKKKTGDTLIHFLQRVRIRRAENYLHTTDLSVNEIGAMVGYPNDNYFIKVFVRWTKQTPSQYRKSAMT